jgi:hypothetical protein
MNSEETRAAQIFRAHHGFVKGLAFKHAPWPGFANDIAQQVFGEFAQKETPWDLDSDVKPLLQRLPKTGPLFPKLRPMQAGHRATEFKRACRRAGITGVTLHSERHARQNGPSRLATRNGSRWRRWGTTARRSIGRILEWPSNL